MPHPALTMPFFSSIHEAPSASQRTQAKTLQLLVPASGRADAERTPAAPLQVSFQSLLHKSVDLTHRRTRRDFGCLFEPAQRLLLARGKHPRRNPRTAYERHWLRELSRRRRCAGVGLEGPGAQRPRFLPECQAGLIGEGFEQIGESLGVQFRSGVAAGH